MLKNEKIETNVNDFLEFLNSYIIDYKNNYEPNFPEKLNPQQKLMKEHYHIYKNLIPIVEEFLVKEKSYESDMTIDTLKKHFQQRYKDNVKNSIKYRTPQAKQITKKEQSIINSAFLVLNSIK